MVDDAVEGDDAGLEGAGAQSHVTSPYATGDGGGTFEARVATGLLR